MFGGSKTTDNIPQRAKSFLLLFLMLLSVAATTTMPILQYSNVSAADSDPNTTLDQQIKRNMYYYMVSYCIQNSYLLNFGVPNRTMTYDDAKYGRWFSNNGAWNVAAASETTFSANPYMYGTTGVSNGEVNCGNESMIMAAMSSLGISNPIEALCASGFERDDGGDANSCEGNRAKNNADGTPGIILGSTEQKFNYQFAGSRNESVRLFGIYAEKHGVKQSFSEAELYYFYKRVLKNTCLRGIDGPPSTTKYGSDNGKTGLEGVTVASIGSDGMAFPDTGSYTIYKPEYTWYQKALFFTPPGRILWSANQIDKALAPSCSDLVKSMDGENNKNVNAYVDLLNKFKQANPNSKLTTVGDLTNEGANSSSCGISGVGWIICPVVNLLGYIVDGSWNILQDFLETSPSIVAQDSATYQAWTAMRSIANVAFVIVFLIIIFSQITSVGISNYGIKKLLPRIVIAAILVNVSFFVCQVVVDLSNILGYSVKSMLDGMGGSATPPQFMTNTTTGDGGAGIVGLILAGTAGIVVMYSSLGLLIPVLLAAIVAVVMILFILVARQAIIILLVVISPLAFVAFLLPNTSSLFEKWRKTLTAMLVLFPVVALVIGASGFAAKILTSVFNQVNPSGLANGEWIGQIAAAAVSILPLFIIPGLLKKSLDTIPALGSLASKWSDKANSRVSSKAGDAWKNTDLARGMAARTQLKQKYRDRDYAKRLGTSGLTRTLSGGVPMPGAEAKYVRRSLEGAALSAANKADTEDVSAQQSLLESQILAGKTTSDQAFKDAVAKNDAVGARAAMSIQLQSGGGRDRAHQLIKDAAANSQFASSGNLSKLQGHIASTNPSLSDKDASLGNWSHVGGDLNAVEKDPGTFKITDANMAGQSEATLKMATAAGKLDASQAARILATPALTVGLKPGERAYFEQIAGGASAQNQSAPSNTSPEELKLDHNPENWNDKNDPKNQFRGY
ncbi:hypothetical protein AUK57_04195 [Candidatus Saccharibacteria bacterium CG2_30_41_52]|nr:MAG: hypothetical protein AUK57_04195 [Candidatus Saccharibacteria bacterium CG2_30_41_52]